MKQETPSLLIAVFLFLVIIGAISTYLGYKYKPLEPPVEVLWAPLSNTNSTVLPTVAKSTSGDYDIQYGLRKDGMVVWKLVPITNTFLYDTKTTN